jgi:hypothetical protein
LRLQQQVRSSQRLQLAGAHQEASKRIKKARAAASVQQQACSAANVCSSNRVQQ